VSTEAFADMEVVPGIEDVAGTGAVGRGRTGERTAVVVG